MKTLVFHLAFLVLLSLVAYRGQAQSSTTYYVSVSGSDTADGLSPEGAFKSLSKINLVELSAGDSVLFRAGEVFIGQLVIDEEGGEAGSPLVIGSYGVGEKPIIDGDGFLASMHVINSGYLHIKGLEFKNDGGPAKANQPENLRYGLYIQNTFDDGTKFSHYRLNDLTFKNIYPTNKITDNDQTGTHAYGLFTSGSGWNDESPTRHDDMLIENCFLTRIGRHAMVIRSTNNLIIRNNLFEYVGGAGMVMAAFSTNILVENNTTNYTGSDIDSRMAARGSGLWAYRTTNMVVQNNRFMHARGIKDSFGMHLDIGNRNAVYQYNYSEDNEGGFVEILGANVNVGYRYNLSIGDGWRSRGAQSGKTFWISGWSGTANKPVGSDSVFIYNNSVYVPANIKPSIQIVEVTQNTRIYNNIVYVAGEFGTVEIKNDPGLNDFDNNIWFGDIPNRDTDDEEYMGANSIIGDPLYTQLSVTHEDGFKLQSGSPALGSGKRIQAPAENVLNYFDHVGPLDFFGNAVSNPNAPNIGAYNGGPQIVNGLVDRISLFEMYPNPVQSGGNLAIHLPASLERDTIGIELVSLSGRMLQKHKKWEKKRFNLPLEGIQAGTYIVRIKGKNIEMARLVIVK